MRTSVFSFVRNAISLGYPIVESIYNLLPLASEVVLVDCGSTDGTVELLRELSVNPAISLHHDTWVNGLGGRNYNKSSDLCHSLCNYNTIIFAEADEVWEESLVLATKPLLDSNNHLKFWRFQLTQNFQRSSWYLSPNQVLPRVIAKGSCKFIEGNTDNTSQAVEVPLEHGYIVDCRNNFRDCYIRRENEAKTIWNDHNRPTTRMVPEHVNYSWEMTDDQIAVELADSRWTFTTTPFRLPEILKWHLGKTEYQIRPELVQAIRHWHPLT